MDSSNSRDTSALPPFLTLGLREEREEVNLVVAFSLVLCVCLDITLHISVLYRSSSDFEAPCGSVDRQLKKSGRQLINANNTRFPGTFWRGGVLV